MMCKGLDQQVLMTTMDGNPIEYVIVEIAKKAPKVLEGKELANQALALPPYKECWHSYHRVNAPHEVPGYSVNKEPRGGPNIENSDLICHTQTTYAQSSTI